MELSEFLEKIRIREHPQKSGRAQKEEKDKIIVEENQTGFRQPHDKSHHDMMVKPKVIFGLSQEMSSTVISYQNYRREIRCDVGEIEDYWNVKWRKSIVRCMEGLPEIHCVERESTSWIHFVREET